MFYLTGTKTVTEMTASSLAIHNLKTSLQLNDLWLKKSLSENHEKSLEE